VSQSPASPPAPDPAALALRIRALAREAGFQRCGITGIELGEDEQHLRDWLAQGLYGSMAWMARHGDKRSRPAELIPGTLRVVSVGLDYGRNDDDSAWDTLAEGERAYVARYALGRDYHKLMRNRLQKLADRIAEEVGPFGHRVFVDSAPVLERALARNAGLGWIGKHTCLIDRDGGSWFFLGEIYLDLPLPVDPPASGHCGTCTRCIDVCPTGAITAPHRLDARRCISYLTIEHEGSIDEELRPLIGNRIFGCDDCQLVCPWNKFEEDRRTRLPRAQQPRPRHAGRAVRMDGRRIPAAHGRLRNPPQRARALAAQHRRRAGQRPDDARRDRRAAVATRRARPGRSRTRALGAGAARCCRRVVTPRGISAVRPPARPRPSVPRATRALQVPAHPPPATAAPAPAADLHCAR